MKAKLVHPIWVNLPSVMALILLVIYIITNGPFPARVAVHFGTGGEPNAYGSPWFVFALVIGISILFIGISVLVDELWARQEKTKMFNWFSLLDDIVVGTMVGITLGYLAFLHHNDALFRFPWGYFGLVGGSTTASGSFFGNSAAVSSLPWDISRTGKRSLQGGYCPTFKGKFSFLLLGLPESSLYHDSNHCLTGCPAGSSGIILVQPTMDIPYTYYCRFTADNTLRGPTRSGYPAKRYYPLGNHGI